MWKLTYSVFSIKILETSEIILFRATQFDNFSHRFIFNSLRTQNSLQIIRIKVSIWTTYTIYNNYR